MLKSKHDVFATFRRFYAFVTTHTGTKLRSLRMYDVDMCTNAFHMFCDDLSIKREFVMSNNSSYNDVAENHNRTLCERVRCMLSTANLSYGFWGEALQITVYLCNRFPHMSLKGDNPIGFGLSNLLHMITYAFLVAMLMCIYGQSWEVS